MKKIYVYIFSLLILGGILTRVRGQETDTSKIYGLRLGVDVARAAYLFSSPAEKGLEFSADFEVHPNLYAVFESGYNSTSFSTDYYQYAASGSYFRFGVDYNFLKTPQKPNYHMIYGGLRYGFSPMKEQFTDAVLPSELWGDKSFSGEYIMTAHWFGLAGGVTVEILQNLYLGWMVQLNFILSSFDNQPDPFLVPGYGILNDNKAVTIHYSILYTIPFFKR